MMARELVSGYGPDDIVPGDWVTGPFKGKGLVEEINGDPPHAIVTVGGLRHLIPTANLRLAARNAGWSLDFRR